MWFKEKIGDFKIVFQFEDGRKNFPKNQQIVILNDLQFGNTEGSNIFLDFDVKGGTVNYVPYTWKTVKVYKTELITKIKAIIEEHGDFLFCDVDHIEIETPFLNTADPLTHSIEAYYKNGVEVYIYAEKYGDDEVATYFVPYEKLSRTNLEDIFEMAEQFKINKVE